MSHEIRRNIVIVSVNFENAAIFQCNGKTSSEDNRNKKTVITWPQFRSQWDSPGGQDLFN